jgi:hypothetical protein
MPNWKRFVSAGKQSLTKFSREVDLARARLELRVIRSVHWIAAHRRWPYLILTALATTGTALLAPWIIELIEPFITPTRVTLVQQAMMALGGALVGATVITFSFIMFALQVNVERMPHGLFQRLSSDWRLLVAFLIAFVSAIGVLVLSLADTAKAAAQAVVLAALVTATILFLVLYSYRRALQLISPIQQLRLVLRYSQRELQGWSRRATRMAPLIETGTEKKKDDQTRFALDVPRLSFFQLNSNWSARARKGIDYAIALARYYAEHGDHEVSGAAIQAIVNINSAYVEAKGKTFIGVNPLVDTPLTSDGFFNETLEALRQVVQAGISRGDEREIEQALRGLGALSLLYTSIQYGDEREAKHHARLAAGYLESAIESVVPHNMPDVLITGVRVLGNVATQFVTRDKDASSTITPARCITGIAATGIKNQKHRPVSEIAVGQLSQLTLALLLRSEEQYAFGAKRVREGIVTLAELFLQVPESPLQQITTQCMGPYFSVTGNDSLPSKLRDLANEILKAEADNEHAAQVIRNICQWGEDLYHPYRELLKEATKRNSHFTFDLIHGIKSYAVIFTALSTAPACPEYTRSELLKAAEWLLWAITWVPAEKEAIACAESSRVAQQLFEAAMDARRFDVVEVVDAAREVLLNWTIKAGSLSTGWASLDTGLFASSILAVLANEEAWLLGELKRQLQKANIDKGLRETAAERLLESVDKSPRQFPTNLVDHVFKDVDHVRMRDLAQKIAEILRSSSDPAPLAPATAPSEPPSAPPK